MSDRFNENTRVQVPAAMHLCRLGYAYLDDIREDDYEPHTNILVKVFRAARAKITQGDESERTNSSWRRASRHPRTRCARRSK